MNIVNLKDIKLIHKNPLHTYALTMRKQKEKLRKHPIHHCNKKNNIPRNKPDKTKDLYAENCKTLMKEIKDNINRWRDIPYS